MTNSQQDDQNALVESHNQLESASNSSNSALDVYFSARLSLLGLISSGGLVSFYYYHNDLVVTGVTAGISALTLLPLPSIIKGTFDFFRNKKAVEAEKDKKLLGMTIKTTVEQQQAISNADLKEFISFSQSKIEQQIASVNQRIDGVNQRIDGAQQDATNNFGSLTQVIVGVRQNCDAIENRLNSKLIEASGNTVDIQKQLIDLDRKISSGQTEAHNDVQALSNRITDLSKYLNDQLLEIRQRSNIQE